MSGPLTGLRVVDLSRVLAGPSLTQIFADLGAEIIKIERPGSGDDTRHWGPPWLQDIAGNDTREAGYYLSTNRGKHSLTVDISKPEGGEIIRELVAEADFFVENFKVGGLEKMGLDYNSLKKINPQLIYLSITGFGQTGPDASQPGYDYLIQARSGLMSVTGPEDGAPGAGPVRGGVATCDLHTGLMGAVGLLSALHHRHVTGQGQYIDLALLDTQIAGLANQGFNHLMTGRVPVRTGAWHPALAPYQPFETADDQIIIAVGNDTQFADMCRVIGAPELAIDQRFSTNPMRNKHRAEMEKLINQRTRQKPAKVWLAGFTDNNVPASPINNIKQAFEDPQVSARGMQIELQHPVAGTMPGMATPLKFSETQLEYKKSAPMLGEDTNDVLTRVLGKTALEVARLKKDGIV
jgi:crotonobetainyl-CoA:carnitine CoA-transferase CaiB-like acyl-CoA transferase